MLALSKNFPYGLNVAIKKILNTTKIRRVLTHSFAAALIAKGGFLSTASAKEIVIDFEDNEITQERLLAGLKEKESQYVYNCNTLAETLEKAVQNKELTIMTDYAEDLRRNCLTPFHHLIVGDVWDHLSYKSFKGADKSSKMGIEAVKFVAALEILEERDTADTNLKQAEGNLCVKAKKFLASKFQNLMRSNRSEGFVQQLKELKEAADPMPNIVLQKGLVKAETSSRLFENFKKPFRLTFDKVEGVFCAGDTLKQLVVSLAFSQSHLEFTPQCFGKAPLLESLIVKDFTLFIFGNLSFAECPKLEGPFQGNGRILLDADRPGSIVSAFEDCPNIKKEDVKKVALNFFISNVQDGHWTDNEQAEAYLENNQLHKAYLEFFHRFKVEQERAKLEKDFESLKKKGDKLEKEISRLKTVNEKQRSEAEALRKENQPLKKSVKTAQENYEKLSQDLLQATNKYENFKKQQTETVEKLTKELEETQMERDLTKQQLWEARDKNKELQRSLKNLESDNETQKEEIENLQALKEEWKGKIDTATALETENSELKKQLIKVTEEKNEAERKLNGERKRNDEVVKEKKQTIGKLEKNLENLRSELAKTQALLFEAQTKIKELQNSESYVLNTMDVIREDKEEPKEEIKNDDFRFNFSKNTFQQKQNTNKKSFYPKKKDKKGKKYVEYNREFAYEN